MKAGFFALLAPLVLAAPALAEEISIEGARMSRDFACEDGQDVVISGAENHVSLTGRCGVVKVLGSKHGLSFEAADALVVSGISIQAEGKAVGNLVVEVTKNRVRTTVKPSAERAKVDVSGADQEVELTLAGPTQIEMQGAKNVLRWRAAPDVKPPSVSASGIENQISRY
ncbi:DUF3060 domain-containing protein [Bosea thiooxidans]|nr:DUF3060 domain-containing protein [Bosea sp. (in: a-proteobacteria)]